ncbi:LysR family transcriptional regulator [Nocardioides sp. BP30]|uniref:LysR family transcriptional regulator n=1 Tax=Nocardioides sp. BP30 TaxID=3036374 RepID=UPI00246906ED|nr:LysR family transcriptional regulator [Nocardioides sp. BP30]WGL52599.1 LysR family transcriptional regulator [Nocardioides sp. BP30]
MADLRDISLNQLVYFARCAELSSMTEAAASLHIAQSAVSTSIANLERRLGAPLFVRRRAKGLVLTAAGEIFLVRARRVLADVADAIAAVDTRSLTGRLRVGVFPTLAPFYAPEIAQRLAQAHPGLDLEFVEVSAGDLEQALGDHAIEVALTYDLGMSVAIHREHLRQASIYVAVGPEHRLADRSRVDVRELAEEPMVLLDLPHSRDYFTQTFTRLEIAPVIRHRFTNFEAVRAMVARGHGFTLLNQRPVHDLTYDGGRLVVIELDHDQAGSLDIVLASPAPIAALSRRATAFVEQCRAVVGERQRSDVMASAGACEESPRSERQA